jgi:hypothetical protein
LLFRNLTRLVRTATRTHYKSIESKILSSTSTRSLFAYIRAKLAPSSNSLLFIEATKHYINNAKDIVAAFCSYFASVFVVDKPECPLFPKRTNAVMPDIIFTPELT